MTVETATKKNVNNRKFHFIENKMITNFEDSAKYKKKNKSSLLLSETNPSFGPSKVYNVTTVPLELMQRFC